MSPLKADKKALSFVPQIKQAHAALAEAEAKGFQQSLALAIELGVLLNLAHETVYHGHWENWFNQQGFDFSRRSATRYMRLAREREKLEDERNWPRVAKMAAEGELSVRVAETLLKPQRSEAEKAKAAAEAAAKKAEKDAKKATAAEAAKAARKSQDLADVLEDKAPDEVLLAIGDKEKKEELLKEQLKSLTAYSVVDLLTEVWEVSQLKTLGEQLADYLKRKVTAPAPPMRRIVEERPSA
jgi:Protein of unknown function (DUF3102)